MFLCCSIQSSLSHSNLFEIICSLVFILAEMVCKKTSSVHYLRRKIFLFLLSCFGVVVTKILLRFWIFEYHHHFHFLSFFRFLLNFSFNFQLIRSRFDCLEEKWTTAMRKERLWDRGLQTIFFFHSYSYFYGFFLSYA